MIFSWSTSQTFEDYKVLLQITCLFKSAGRLSIYDAGSLYPDFIPKLGMGHVTLAGVKHHGMRNFEAWIQTMAPGVATPIHSHPDTCEEINYVLQVSRELIFRTPQNPNFLNSHMTISLFLALGEWSGNHCKRQRSINYYSYCSKLHYNWPSRDNMDGRKYR